jgi:hypothetical protein
VRYARVVRIVPVIAVLVLGASCRGPAAGVSAGVALAKETRSNILRGDYVGSATCALLSTLERGRPHEQVAAAMVLAEAKVNAAAPLVARLLASPYPLARRFAAQALDSMLGQPCAVDVDAPPAETQQALARCGLDVLDLPTHAPAGHKPGEAGDED